jgi:hypothetical protein
LGKSWKLFAYLLAVIIGAAFGVLMVGSFLDTVHTVNGIPIQVLGPEKVAAAVTKNANAFKSQTSFVFGRSRVATVDGVWPQFVVLVVPILFAIALARIEISRLVGFAQVGFGRSVVTAVIFALGLIAALIALFQAIGLIPVIGWVVQPSAVPFGMWMAASIKVTMLAAFAAIYWGAGYLSQRFLRRTAKTRSDSREVDGAT